MKLVNEELIKDNVIDEFKHKWALVTARKKDGSFNTCTVSWGSIGELWSKNVVTVYIKPIRFTDEFLKEDEYFTVAFFDSEYKAALGICGTKSGRDLDKIKEANLTPVVLENGISYAEARRVYVCKKIYQGQFKQEEFVDSKEIIDRYYKEEPYHNFYIGEIKQVYEK